MTEAYRLGFIEKCAEYNVDPVRLVKVALTPVGLLGGLATGIATLGGYNLYKTFRDRNKPQRPQQGQPAKPVKPIQPLQQEVPSSFGGIVNNVKNNTRGYFGTPRNFYYNGRPVSSENQP